MKRLKEKLILAVGFAMLVSAIARVACASTLHTETAAVQFTPDGDGNAYVTVTASAANPISGVSCYYYRDDGGPTVTQPVQQMAYQDFYAVTSTAGGNISYTLTPSGDFFFYVGSFSLANTLYNVKVIYLTVSAAPTPTPTYTITKTPTATRTTSPTLTRSPTRTVTRTASPTRTVSPSPTITLTKTVSPTPSITRTPTPTPTITITSSFTRTATRTNTPTPTFTQTPLI